MSTSVIAVTLASAAAPSGSAAFFVQIMPLLFIFVIFYFLMIRPQQRRMKQHQAMLVALKRGDSVTLSSGIKGKVVRVEETEVGLEVASGVTVKVVKSMIANVDAKGTPAPANDSKA